MASEGIEKRGDFRDKIYGLNGEDVKGTSITRFRDSYTDNAGVYHEAMTIQQRVLIVPSQAEQPYGISEQGMENIRNPNPLSIYFPYEPDLADFGEPFETDVLTIGRWRSKVSNLNPIPIGDDIVCWQGEVVRIGREIQK